MNSRKLKKNLPRDWKVRSTTQGNTRVTTANGVQFNVDGKAGWQEETLAQYLQSKLPAATVMPPQQ